MKHLELSNTTLATLNHMNWVDDYAGCTKHISNTTLATRNHMKRIDYHTGHTKPHETPRVPRWLHETT